MVKYHGGFDETKESDKGAPQSDSEALIRLLAKRLRKATLKCKRILLKERSEQLGNLLFTEARCLRDRPLYGLLSSLLWLLVMDTLLVLLKHIEVSVQVFPYVLSATIIGMRTRFVTA